MTNKRNKTRAHLSDSPTDLEKNNTQRHKQIRMNTSEQDLDDVAVSDGEMSLSLNELRKLIRSDIREAADNTNTRINEMSAEIKHSVSKLESEMECIKTSQQYISDEFDAMKEIISHQKDEICTLKKDVSQIKSDCVTTHQRIEELNYEMNTLKQASFEGHLLISNVIKVAQEDLRVLLKNMFALVNIDYDAEGVLSVGRLSSSNQNGIQPILVRFASALTKERLMKASRQRPIFCDEIGLGVKQRIFFNHRLTPANQRLLAAARKHKREHNYKFVWFMNGEVFLRKDEDSRAIKINDVQDLCRLI